MLNEVPRIMLMYIDSYHHFTRTLLTRAQKVLEHKFIQLKH